MTIEQTRKTDRKAMVVIIFLLAVSLIGFGLYWFIIRNEPDNPPYPNEPSVTPVATVTATSRPTIAPPTNTPIPTATAFPTVDVTPTALQPSPSAPPLPEDTPTPTPTVQGSTPVSCVGVQGGYKRFIFKGDTLWDIWFNEVCGVEWADWLRAVLDINLWLKDPNRIHPTGANGYELLMPVFEVSE